MFRVRTAGRAVRSGRYKVGPVRSLTQSVAARFSFALAPSAPKPGRLSRHFALAVRVLQMLAILPRRAALDQA